MEKLVTIAERVLTWNAAKLTIRIHAPTRNPDNEDWQCVVHLETEGSDAPVVRIVTGGDSLDAICLAIEGARQSLEERFADAYQWVPGDGACIPFMLKHVLPPPYQQRLHEHLVRERVRKHGELVREAIRDRRARGEPPPGLAGT